MSASVLVCFALKQEAKPFQKRMGVGAGVQVLITGIGARNAEQSVLAAFQIFRPERVFTCGFAGALNPDLQTGDVIFDPSTASAEVRTKLESLNVRPGTFVIVPRIATTAAEKQQLRRSTGADAVEMESGAIHAVCRDQGISCMTVRVISDTANEDLPLDFNQLQKPDSSLDFGALALAIAKSPGKIAALLRLQKNCQRAAERLADALTRIISA